MKKILNTIFIFVSFFVVFSNSEVKAAKFGGHLINGPRNMLYTVNGGAEDYVVNINTAVYNWMYTGYDNPIYMTAVSSLSGSTVDFYSEYLSNNITARTFFFDSQSQLILIEQLKNQNWLYNEIYVNDKDKYDYSIDHTGTMAHEVGHA